MVARSPMRPTSFISPTWARPVTIVVKTIGPISMRISLMKPSPSGRIAAPVSGQIRPTAMPMAIAKRTCA
jgi:hypothetical protein